MSEIPAREPLALGSWFNQATDQHAAQRHTLIIGEVGQAHDGSLGTAHSYIDAIADAGADAVKFQTHIAAAESTADEPWRVRFSPQDDRRIDYWRRMEFTRDQWAGLKEHAEASGLLFLSSPFSLEAVELLEGIGVEGWKIASGELTNAPMLRAIAATAKPVLLSTGMSDWAEIDGAIELLRTSGCGPVAIFQCTSAYPCPPESVGLNLISEIASRYGCPAGLSDHSGTIFPTLAGVAQGMQLAEVHVTLSKRAFGPDVPASLTVAELNQLVLGTRAIESMLAHPVDKEEQAKVMEPMRSLFQRSLVAATDLESGHVLKETDLVAKKPAKGLSPEVLPKLVGQRLVRSLDRDQRIAFEDVGNTSEDVK